VDPEIVPDPARQRSVTLPPMTSRFRFLAPKYWPTWLLLALQRLLLLLPFPLVSLIGLGLGNLLYRTGKRRRHVAARNLERCLPQLDPAQHEALLRENFRLLGLALLAAPAPWWLSPRHLERLVHYRNREIYDTALASGRPVILLMPHFMALEIAMVLSRGQPMMFMYQKLKNPLMDAVMARGRSRFGAELVERSAPLKGMVKNLKRGKPLIYLPDQNPGPRRGIFVPFFGIETATHPALSRIASMTNAVVVPCLCQLLPHGHGYEIEFRAPLADFPSGDAEHDTARMNEVIEQAVRDMPEQYFWVHQRFKVRPEGEPGFYR